MACVLREAEIGAGLDASLPNPVIKLVIDYAALHPMVGKLLEKKRNSLLDELQEECHDGSRC